MKVSRVFAKKMVPLKGLSLLAHLYATFSAVIFLLIMFTQAADVATRILWRPVTGMDELVCYGMAIVVSCAIFYTALHGGHVTTDLLLSRLPARLKRVTVSVILLLSSLSIVVMAWQGILLGLETQARGLRSFVLTLPLFPFRYILAFGCMLAAIVFLVDFLRSIGGGDGSLDRG